MAGGGNARDKMIGMMYLVLTALLALQVSNSVLEKFILISDTFEATNQSKIDENHTKVEAIRQTVEKSGNRAKDVAVFEKAKRVREESAVVFEKLADYKKLLITETGDYDDSGAMKGQKDIDTAPRIFVKEGEGEVLKKILNDYSAFLREISGDSTIHDIAKDAKDIPVFSKDPNQRTKGFADLNFGHNTPMVGALASLSQFQADVVAEESKALTALGEAVGAEDLKFDKIVPMVRPVSRVVAAGTLYEADMFISASSSAVKPKMTINGKDLKVVEGMGKISFTASTATYDKSGNATKSFVGAITVTLPSGRDTTYTQEIEYVVSKPVIQIQSASVQALYLNCGNELNVQVPALGVAYNPTFTASGGQTFKGAEKGMVTILPKAAKVELKVSSGGNLIGTESFKVRRIPQPQIVVMSRGRPVDLKKGVKGAPRSIKLVAQPDESFSQFLPKDAKFRVDNAEITLVRSGRAVQSTRAKSPDVNLSRMASQARSGDALVIEIKKVIRRNFRGDIENFANFGPKIITIRIN